MKTIVRKPLMIKIIFFVIFISVDPIFFKTSNKEIILRFSF